MSEKHHCTAVRKVETQEEAVQVLKLWLATDPENRVFIDNGEQLFLALRHTKQSTLHDSDIDPPTPSN